MPRKNPLARQPGTSTLLPLPGSFLFGVATADHQCEAYDANREDIRDLWERQLGQTRRGCATDFEHRYPEDIDLARQLGCNAFRFSIAWSRVEPAPGQFDGAAFDHYRSLIAAIRTAGMEPILTLHHFTWPVHLEARGGMLADDFPAIFGAYAGEVVRRCGQDVRYWVTFNEPTQLLFGYIKPWWSANYPMPPGLPGGASIDDQVEAVGNLIRNLFLAHTQARRVIRSINREALVSANPLVLGLPAWLQRLVDWNATRIRTPADFLKQGRRLAVRGLPGQGAVDVVLADLTPTRAVDQQTLLSQPYFVASPATPYAAMVAPGNGDLLDVIEVTTRDLQASAAWTASHTRDLGGSAPGPLQSMARSLAPITQPGLADRMARRLGTPAGPLPLAQPGTALRRIQDRGHIIVAVKSDAPGLSVRDAATGEYSGLQIDLARALAQRIFGDAEKLLFRAIGTEEPTSLLRSAFDFLNPLRKGASILSTLATGSWWQLGMAGKLPEFLCPAECVGQQDFVGLDYYWGIRSLRLDRIGRLIDAASSNFDRAPVWPEALHGLLRYHAHLAPGLPLLVVENGSVEVTDGVDRATYIRRHVEQVQRAIRDGVKVIGYVCWTITSNREWGLPFGKGTDFGLYHIELDTDPALTRVPTAAAAAYREIIARRRV